jgi:hypothetical protein
MIRKLKDGWFAEFRNSDAHFASEFPLRPSIVTEGARTSGTDSRTWRRRLADFAARRRTGTAPSFYDPSVRVISGKVVSGKVIVEGEPLEEGATVTVLVRDSDETFGVSNADEDKLVDSLGEAVRGETIPASDVLRGLGPRP